MSDKNATYSVLGGIAPPAMSVDVRMPDMQTMPSQEAPQVHVAAPEVHVAAPNVSITPQVSITVPEAPAPVIHLEKIPPPNVEINPQIRLFVEIANKPLLWVIAFGVYGWLLAVIFLILRELNVIKV